MRTPEQNRAHVQAWLDANPANKERARARAAKWRIDNPTRTRELNRDYRKRNPEKVRVASRRKRLARYGLTPEAWRDLFAAQDEKCAVCRAAEHDGNGWHVDHDHETGKVRGILCVRCNIGIGQFEDAPIRLRAAADYIERTR